MTLDHKSLSFCRVGMTVLWSPTADEWQWDMGESWRECLRFWKEIVPLHVMIALLGIL